MLRCISYLFCVWLVFCLALYLPCLVFSEPFGHIVWDFSLTLENSQQLLLPIFLLPPSLCILLLGFQERYIRPTESIPELLDSLSFLFFLFLWFISIYLPSTHLIFFKGVQLSRSRGPESDSYVSVSFLGEGKLACWLWASWADVEPLALPSSGPCSPLPRLRQQEPPSGDLGRWELVQTRLCFCHSLDCGE